MTAMPVYPARYGRPRWKIAFGAYAGLEKFALEALYRAVQRYLPYVVEVTPAAGLLPASEDDDLIVPGTPESSPLVADLLERGVIRLPGSPQGFTAAGLASPWNPARRVVVIAASEPAGLLNGVEVFNARVLAARARLNPIAPQRLLGRALDRLGDFHFSEAPAVPERGIWSWGYVIYDHRRFLDHMARLRLNLLTIWNDTPPLNASEIIQEARARGIRVFLGFPWGWGRTYDLADPAHQQAIADDAVRHYQELVLPLAPDGIYFQTLTEHALTELGGQSVAALTCDLVNRITARLFALNPGLAVHFGLHATSIQGQFSALSALDPRVTILWEDAGALPYAYAPSLVYQGRTFEQTLEYSRALAALRPGAPFGMVAKGWTTLDWVHAFEHHRGYLAGVRSEGFIRRRLAARQPRWSAINALWRRYFPAALAFYREMLAATGGNMIVEGLVEDGLLEARIQSSVALFAETLWNPALQPSEVLSRARSPYYREF